MIEPKQIDTPAMIKRCLECPFKECWNCLGGRNPYTYGLLLELDDRKLKRETKRLLKEVSK